MLKAGFSMEHNSSVDFELKCLLGKKRVCPALLHGSFLTLLNRLMKTKLQPLKIEPGLA